MILLVHAPKVSDRSQKYKRDLNCVFDKDWVGTDRGTFTRMPGARVPLWCWWIVVVWAISLPWFGFTPHPQWWRVHWVPLGDPADNLRDLIANVALFVPFGYSYAGRERGGVSRGLLGAALASLAVSLVAESTQVFSVLRYPSATDLSAACAGSLIGAAWRGRGDPRSSDDRS